MPATNERLGPLGITACAIAIACGAVGCTGPLRGAAVVEPADVPRGTLIATFARTQCMGNQSAAPTVFVDYVQGVDGTAFIVERSRPDSWLLITNGRLVGDAIIFQTVREGTDFQEYRFSRRGGQPGRYYWASEFAQPWGSKHHFETRPLGTPVTCQLLPVDPVTGERKTGSRTSGWGFDGSSFRVGDRLLVNVEGRAVPAEVMQAPGKKYFVRFEGEAAGGRWIEPSEITGRLEK